MTFYDRHGNPKCYTMDNIHIYDFSGNPIAYIYNTGIWTYSGTQLGWLYNGSVIDASRSYLLFSEYSIGGPLKPLRKLCPLKGLRHLRPLKSLRSMMVRLGIVNNHWSDFNFEQVFYGI